MQFELPEPPKFASFRAREARRWEAAAAGRAAAVSANSQGGSPPSATAAATGGAGPGADIPLPAAYIAGHVDFGGEQCTADMAVLLLIVWPLWFMGRDAA